MFFVLKVSKLCNLRCRYCYEYDELADKSRMPLEGLEFFLRNLRDHYLREQWAVELKFVLHGGEPLLLPENYLRTFVELQTTYLGAHGIPYRNSLQTNLTRLTRRTIQILDELGIGLGISLDVFGGQRVTITGEDSQERVLDNLQLLFDSGAVRRLGVGGISVLHSANVHQAVKTFHFYNELGLSYRILPIFSITEPPARMRHLTLGPAQVVDALLAVTRTLFESRTPIRVYPLWNFLTAATHAVTGAPAATYDPRIMEWALIVNTNGDVYNHAEAYTEEGLMGNIFREAIADILSSGGRQGSLRLREERGKVCDACPHGQSCSRIPIIEALPSERTYDLHGQLECQVARPMIDFMVDEIQKNPSAMTLLGDAVPG